MTEIKSIAVQQLTKHIVEDSDPKFILLVGKDEDVLMNQGIEVVKTLAADDVPSTYIFMHNQPRIFNFRDRDKYSNKTLIHFDEHRGISEGDLDDRIEHFVLNTETKLIVVDDLQYVFADYPNQKIKNPRVFTAWVLEDAPENYGKSLLVLYVLNPNDLEQQKELEEVSKYVDEIYTIN